MPSQEEQAWLQFVANLTAGVLRGKAALCDYFAQALNPYPTLRFEFIRVYLGVRSCVLEYRSINGLRAAENLGVNQ